MQWKDEAVEKLKRYGAMQKALENIPEEIQRLEADATALHSPSSETVSVKGGGRREDALINNIAQRQELEWTLKQVQQWLVITDRGLAALTPEERLVLQRMYLYPEKGPLTGFARSWEWSRPPSTASGTRLCGSSPWPCTASWKHKNNMG